MGEQSFLHATQCGELIHISINVHEDISHSYQVMWLYTKIINNQKTIPLKQNIKKKP